MKDLYSVTYGRDINGDHIHDPDKETIQLVLNDLAKFVYEECKKEFKKPKR